MGSSENPNWVLDYAYLDDIHSLSDPSNFSWPPPPTPLSADLHQSLPNSNGPDQSASRKRLRSGSCNTSGSKACREKMRRDRLNDRFLELGSILDPGRPPKTDKAAILSDAVQLVLQLRGEAQKLKESTENLQEKINELKAEKNELRDEKQRLKAEKDSLEKQLKALNTPSGFLHHPPTLPAVFPHAPGQVLGSKLVPFMGYPGVSMWQFLPPAAVDTSQDHVLRPPVA
ncbi:transcription factor ILR3-like [Arachis stenosperma]|uniref:transcription factor ILR3-like n=1 Tax=Arachis stenosperma TaxID=217475 RepID=UPI0025ABAC0D|nr:transcription factor ILR3-like [Arachis stenosperma]